MKHLLISISVTIYIFGIISCEKSNSGSNTSSVSCSSFEMRDTSAIQSELDNLFLGLAPDSTVMDPHLENLEQLIDAINDNCPNVSAVLLCFGCVEVGCGISEIEISVPNDKYIIDICSQVDTMRFAGIHN